MTRRLLTSSIAFLFLLVVAAPTTAAELPGLEERLERFGKLPTDLIKAKKTDAEIVDALFMATLIRLPTDAEKETVTKHLATAKNREDGAQNLVWALINTKEFVKLNGMDKDVLGSLMLLNSLAEKWGRKEADKDKK
jgi:hypothetical protein